MPDHSPSPRTLIAILTLAAAVQLARIASSATAPPLPVAPPSPKHPPIPVTISLADTDQYAAFPYLKGWPIKLKGTFSSTPSVAELNADGKKQIIINAILTLDDGEPLRVILAMGTDGKVLPGWPAHGGFDQRYRWTGSPGIFRNQDRDNIVAATSGGPVMVISPDGSSIQLPIKANAGDCLPLFDSDKDGITETVAGVLACTVKGDPTWAGSLESGFSPCVGDAVGDGKLFFYQLAYSTQGMDAARVIAYDHEGNPAFTDQWPKMIDDPSCHGPVMGDITGDDKMEVVAAYGTHIFAWNYDGSPLPNTHDHRMPPQANGEEPLLTGILVDNVNASAVPPVLADLDGDGKAEIIIFDDTTKSIRAWHGDGRPFGSGSLGKINASGVGVSVVSLGDDPTISDLFCGTTWIRIKPDSKIVSIKQMAPDDVHPAPGTQPTVTDIDGDGNADIIFASDDGRLFIYRTGLAFHPDRAQWPTVRGNFQHTGAWKKPGK